MDVVVHMMPTTCNWSSICSCTSGRLPFSQRLFFPLRRRTTSPLSLTPVRATKADAEITRPIPFSSSNPQILTHTVTVHDRQRGVVHQFLVPEDQYILHTAESQNISLPFACRHGCCTSCAVRVKSGQIRQPEALGISPELKSKVMMLLNGKDKLLSSSSTPHLHKDLLTRNRGYALLCVGFPASDIEVETQDEDEVYWLQFGRYFARGPVERDDYALELAMGDE